MQKYMKIQSLVLSLSTFVLISETQAAPIFSDIKEKSKHLFTKMRKRDQARQDTEIKEPEEFLKTSVRNLSMSQKFLNASQRFASSIARSGIYETLSPSEQTEELKKVMRVTCITFQERDEYGELTENFYRLANELEEKRGSKTSPFGEALDRQGKQVIGKFVRLSKNHNRDSRKRGSAREFYEGIQKLPCLPSSQIETRVENEEVSAPLYGFGGFEDKEQDETVYGSLQSSAEFEAVEPSEATPGFFSKTKSHLKNAAKSASSGLVNTFSRWFGS